MLKKKEREACWLSDWDEIALSRILLRCFGLFPSPGANHIGEYIPGWAEDFLGSSLLQFFYDPREGDPWETGDVPTWLYNLSDHPTDAPLFPEKPLQRLKPSREDRIAGDGELHPSGELAVPIIEGLACGVKRGASGRERPEPWLGSRGSRTGPWSRCPPPSVPTGFSHARWSGCPRRFSRCCAHR